MEQLKELHLLFKEILDICEQIITKVFVLSLEIIDGSENYENVNKKSVESRALELIYDAKIVKFEKDNFIKNLIQKEPLNPSSFLSQVWMGDIYGSEGVDALKALLNDLKSQLETCCFS